MKKVLIIFLIALIIAGCSIRKDIEQKNDNEVSYKFNEKSTSAEKDMYYYNTAIKNNNIGLCEKIISIYVKSDCLRYFAKEYKDVSICDKITPFTVSGEDQKCYEDIAIIKQDLSLCSKKTDSKYIIDLCLHKVATQSNNSNICDNIENKLTKNDCYNDIAENSKNIDLCQKILENTSFNFCINNLAVKNKDPNLCERSKSYNTSYIGRDYCYEHVSYEINDINLCEKIIDDNVKYSCYRMIQDRYTSPESCEKIKKLERRDDCYLGIAVVKNKKLICNNIFDARIKERCLNAIK